MAHMPTLHERLSDGVETVQYLQGRVALDWATHTPFLTKAPGQPPNRPDASLHDAVCRLKQRNRVSAVQDLDESIIHHTWRGG